MSWDQTDAGFRSITPLQANIFKPTTCKDWTNKNIMLYYVFNILQFTYTFFKLYKLFKFKLGIQTGSMSS